LKEENTNETSNTGDKEIKAGGEDLGVESKLPVEETNAEDDTAIAEVDETAKYNANTAETDSSQNKDTAEEEKTASTPPKRQILDEDDDSKEENNSAPPQQRCDDVSEEENTDTASAPPKHDYGDESEDEFIVPTYEEQQVCDSDDESSKLDGDAKGHVTETKANGASTLSKNSATVSRAALAAIEQARLEAEQMMATKPKKEKKKKKKKDKVKKEKKAKKSKKKEEST